MTTELSASLSPNDPRPLPLIVAEKWNFPLQHYQRFDVENGYLYALQDWAIGLVGEKGKHAMRDFKLTEVGSRLVASNYKLPYKATNGRTYQMDFCTDKTLYLFAQYVRVTDDREVLAAIRRYLAEAGVVVDELRREPESAPEVGMKGSAESLIHAGMNKWRRDGKSEEWIQARISGIITRKQFTEALRLAVLNSPKSLYGQATDKLYTGLWKRTTDQLRGDLDLNTGQNVREHFGRLALTYTDAAEQIATIMLGNKETITMAEAMQVVYIAAKHIHKQAQATAKLLGMDLVTEKPLLPKPAKKS